MTREEAIEILRDTPIDIRSTREDDIHTLYAMAQNIAIEALSADTVSREDYHNLLMASNDIDRALREYQAKEEADADMEKYETFCGVPMDEAYKVMRGYSLGEYVEVVRCKDCIYWHSGDMGTGEVYEPYCEMLDTETEESAFCSDGKRRKP